MGRWPDSVPKSLTLGLAPKTPSHFTSTVHPVHTTPRVATSHVQVPPIISTIFGVNSIRLICAHPLRMLLFKRRPAKAVETDVTLNTSSPLLRLPPELREAIWEYTLTYPSSSDSLHFHVYDEVCIRESSTDRANTHSRCLTNARTKFTP